MPNRERRSWSLEHLVKKNMVNSSNNGLKSGKPRLRAGLTRLRQNRPAEDSEFDLVIIGQSDENSTDWELLKETLEATDKNVSELWLILIGHGTDDRNHSKFNLRGPDVTAQQIGQWLQSFPNRTIILNCSSASGGFISKLKGPKRNRRDGHQKPGST